MARSYGPSMCYATAITGVLVCTGLLLYERGYSQSEMRWIVALIAVVASLPVSLWDIAQHMRYHHNPALQIPVVRILWMVPVYAVDSWLALKFESISLYITTAREIYEAYVIYSFTIFLLRFVALSCDEPGAEPVHSGSVTNAEMVRRVKLVLTRKAPVPHLFPFCHVRPWAMSGSCEFYLKCRRGVSQYVVWRIVASLIAFGCALAGWYEEGSFKFSGAYLYVTIVFTVSQCWALYCLVMVYQALEEELAPMRPIWKFLVVKSVVFFSWYQSVFLSLMVIMEVIPEKDDEGRDMAVEIQSFLICLEMFIAALVHHHVFPYDATYLDAGSSMEARVNPQSVHRSMKGMFYISDIKSDAHEVTENLRTTLISKTREAPGHIKKSYQSLEKKKPEPRINPIH